MFTAINITEAVVQRCSIKKMFLEISQNPQEITCARASFLIKFIKKETLEQVFSCEFCEISRNIFSYRTARVAASDINNMYNVRASIHIQNSG